MVKTMATTLSHGEISVVDDLGNVETLYPKTFSSDVYVDQNKTTLSAFLGNSDISQIGDGTVSGAITQLNNEAHVHQQKSLFKYNRGRCILTDNKGTVTSDYGFTYTQLHDLINDGDNWKDYINNGVDYIRLITTNGDEFELEMNVNTYIHQGTTDVPPHIDLISRDLIPNSVGWKMRTTDTNNGTASQPNPLLASNESGCLVNRLTNYQTYIPTSLRAHLIQKEFLTPYRYASGQNLTDDNGWGWQIFPMLPFVLFEVEVFGYRNWSSPLWQGGFQQYPCFVDGISIVKKDMKGGTRANWWLGGACSTHTANFCNVGTDRCATYAIATNPYLGAPLSVRFV